jgi:hypothetical protein
MSTYLLFDENGVSVNPQALQNRAIWYEHGATQEMIFVKRYGDKLGVCINPEKRSKPTAPDLLYKNNLSDLKCQHTPLFTAGKYGIDPTFAVTFNLKDALNYGQWGHSYKNFSVFYWVHWTAVKMKMYDKTYKAKPLNGLWRVDFSKPEELRRSSPIHWYNQRNRCNEQNPPQRELLTKFEPRLQEGNIVWSIRGSQNNAACSYVFDLNTFEKID